MLNGLQVLTLGMGIVMLYGVSNDALATPADRPSREEIENAPNNQGITATAQTALMSKVR